MSCDTDLPRRRKARRSRRRHGTRWSYGTRIELRRQHRKDDRAGNRDHGRDVQDPMDRLEIAGAAQDRHAHHEQACQPHDEARRRGQRNDRRQTFPHCREAIEGEEQPRRRQRRLAGASCDEREHRPQGDTAAERQRGHRVDEIGRNQDAAVLREQREDRERGRRAAGETGSSGRASALHDSLASGPVKRDLNSVRADKLLFRGSPRGDILRRIR